LLYATISVATTAPAARLNECFWRNDFWLGLGFLPELAGRFELMPLL
jgi:hypothetical protein